MYTENPSAFLQPLWGGDKYLKDIISNTISKRHYKKDPYSQQCPSAGDGGGSLVIHGVDSI